MASKAKADSGGPSTPKWIVTFTDLMSLLLTFFVLLLTFSTPRIEKLFELRGSIEAAFGIFFAKPAEQDDRDTWVPPNPTRQGRDMFNPYAPTLMPRFRPLEDHEPNRDLQRLRDQTGEQIDWDRIESGYRLRLRDAIRYHPGAVDMTADSFPRLSVVAKAVEFIPYHLVVVGTIGQDEVDLIRSRGDDPLQVASQRAMRVAKRLVDRLDVNPEIIAVSIRPPERSDEAVGGIEFILAKTERFSEGR